jgi:hypothetical protein
MVNNGHINTKPKKFTKIERCFKPFNSGAALEFFRRQLTKAKTGARRDGNVSISIYSSAFNDI